MKYLFDYLMENNANQIGNWKGNQVYSISKIEFKNLFEKNELKSDVVYCICDDNKLLVLNNIVIGLLDEQDRICEVHTEETYISMLEKALAAELEVSRIIMEADAMLVASCSWRV